MTDTAESLAQEVIAGSYSPNVIGDCNGALPIDRNPHVVRYRSFLLFGEPAPAPASAKEPGYLILAQYKLRSSDTHPEKAITEELIKPLSRSLAAEMLSAPDDGGVPPPVRLPDPTDGRTDIDRLRRIAMERALPGYRTDMSEAETRALYQNWFKEQITDVLRDQVMERFEVLERSGFDVTDEAATSDVSNAKSLTDILARVIGKVLLPTPYQPFRNPHPHFAVCATFEQIWEPKGYTRGELLNTIGLAPGEQLTLEIHSWDKSTIKSEQELATESEFKVSENITERDVRTVARQVSSNFNISATIPVKGVPVNLGGGLNANVNDTLEQTRERTVQASNTIKNSRRLRIEVAREIGREQKQTRVIANTNRCHALNCHYFEIMTNYVVTTRLVSVTPCLLLNNPQFKATPEWVLCHENVLIAALLDKTFLPGFEAARTLVSQAKYALLAEQEKLAAGTLTPVEQELKLHVDAILGAYDRLRKPAGSVKKASRSYQCQLAKRLSGNIGWAFCVATKVGITALRRVLYFALLYGNKAAVNALEKLENEKSLPPHTALQNFFAAVTPRDFQYDGPTAKIANALDAVGIPEKLVDALLKWGILSYVDFGLDDAGLYNDVKAADAKLKSLMTGAEGTEPTVAAEGGYSKMDIAQAQTGFGQLACHLEKNWVHYAQAILFAQDADQRFLNLQGYGAVAGVLDNDLLGFFGHKAAYPIKDTQAVKPWLDFEQLLRDVKPATPAPQLVTLPTQGTVLEAIVAECDACEDFIQQSRVLDLRTQEAKAKQEEAEARRRELRLDHDPPDLTEFGDMPGGDVNVTVNRPGEPPA